MDRIEPLLGDELRNDGAGDDDPDQDGILTLVDKAGIQGDQTGKED
jgi:hypothetical protein